jgi:hypothetical protein
MVFLMMNTSCLKHVEDAKNWIKILIWKVCIWLVCFTYVFLKVMSEQLIYFPSHTDKTQNGQEFDTGMFGFYQNRKAQMICI